MPVIEQAHRIGGIHIWMSAGRPAGERRVSHPWLVYIGGLGEQAAPCGAPAGPGIGPDGDRKEEQTNPQPPRVRPRRR